MRTRSLAHAARRAALVGALVAAACAHTGCLAPPNVCRGDPGGPTPTADEVCDHLAGLACLAGPIPEYLDGGPEVGPVELDFDAAGAPLTVVHAQECRAGYASWEAMVGPARFPALARCYAAARNCEEVEACNRGCPLSSEAGLSEDGGLPDASLPEPLDGGPPDTGAPDAGASDAGAPDTGADAGALDAG